MGDRPALADRLAHLSPHQREQAGVAVVLCELIDELIEATDRQSALLAERLGGVAENRDGQTRGAGRKAGAAAPSGTPGGDEQGGAQVLLREPAVPPADPDDEPAEPAGADRAVAEPTTKPATADRKPTAKAAAAKKAAAKTPTATREGRR